MCVCVPTADHLSFRPCCGSAALALALAIIPIVLLSLVRLLFSSIWDGLQPLDWVTIVERPVWDTKHKRYRNTNQPELEHDHEVLLEVPDDPSDAAEAYYDPVEQKFRKFLALVIHPDLFEGIL